MALSKGKKVLIAVVAGVVAIGAVIATVFAVKNVAMTYRPGITTPVNPGQNEGQKPGQNEGQKPGQDEGQKPGGGDEGQQGGGDEGQDPGQDDEEQGEEEPGTPEMSEAEYYEKNLDLIKTALGEEYKKDNPNRTLITDENTIVINEALGEIYFIGDTEGGLGAVKNLFFTAKFNNNILLQPQKEINEILKNKEYDLSFTNIRSIRGNLSEDVYKEFGTFLCGQSYDSNGETKTFSDKAVVLDISRYISGDAYGGQYIQFMIVDGEKVYTARLENAMPPGYDDWAIGQIMGYSNNVFKITEIKDFKEFDYDEQDAQAQASVDLSLDFRGTTFDEISATEFASAFFDDSRVSRVHIQYENQDGEEQRGVLVRCRKGRGGENKNTESDKINNMSMLF